MHGRKAHVVWLWMDSLKWNSLSASVSHTLVQEICRKQHALVITGKSQLTSPCRWPCANSHTPRWFAKIKHYLLCHGPRAFWATQTVTFHAETAAYHCAHVVLGAAVSVSDNVPAPPISSYIPIDRNKCLFGTPSYGCRGPGCVCGWLSGDHD